MPKCFCHKYLPSHVYSYKDKIVFLVPWVGLKKENAVEIAVVSVKVYGKGYIGSLWTMSPTKVLPLATLPN